MLSSLPSCASHCPCVFLGSGAPSFSQPTLSLFLPYFLFPSLCSVRLLVFLTHALVFMIVCFMKIFPISKEFCGHPGSLSCWTVSSEGTPIFGHHPIFPNPMLLGLNHISLKKICVSSAPQNVMLFGNRVIADTIN